jgi:hypothetical protein
MKRIIALLGLLGAVCLAMACSGSTANNTNTNRAVANAMNAASNAMSQANNAINAASNAVSQAGNAVNSAMNAIRSSNTTAPVNAANVSKNPAANANANTKK